MRESVLRALVVLLALVAFPLATDIVKDHADSRADTEFAVKAELVRRSANGLLFQEKRLSEAELQTWEAQIAADARRAARRLRPAQKRELALRWLEMQRELRSVRIRIWSVAERRARLEVYGCEEAAFQTKTLSKEHVRFIRSCVRMARQDFDREMQMLRVVHAGLESKARRLWASLVATAPAIARLSPQR